MAYVQQLRSDMTTEEQSVLNEIWAYYCEHNQWVPARLVQRAFGGKSKLEALLDQFNGSIVFETKDNDAVKSYQLTFLGILLTSNGEHYENLLTIYLKYVNDQRDLDPFLKDLDSEKIATDLHINTSILGNLIYLGTFYSSGGGFGSSKWNASVPNDIDDFPDDLNTYIHEHALWRYDPNLPVLLSKREAYLSNNRAVQNKGQQNISSVGSSLVNYVSPTRIEELSAIKSQQFDLTKLVELCKELNDCYSHECYLAVAMLARAVLDHIPPIFGLNAFSQVSNNYSAPRSFKESMEHLEKSLRKIADTHLHQQIRKSEVLPSQAQVNFSRELDVLLGEVVRVLKSP